MSAAATATPSPQATPAVAAPHAVSPTYKTLHNLQPFLCGESARHPPPCLQAPERLTLRCAWMPGGFSACFATGIIHPIDLAKVRLQLFATLNPGVPKPKVRGKVQV
jgi:hypothetical protein